jgi:chromosomal replication initiator protein
MDSTHTLHAAPNNAPRSSPAGQVWHAALGELQLQMTKATFDTWVKPTYAMGYEDETLVVGVRNAYAKQWLENRLYGMIQRTLNHLLGRSAEVKFVLNPNSRSSSAEMGLRDHLREPGRDLTGEESMETREDFSAAESARGASEAEAGERSAPNAGAYGSSGEYTPYRANGSTLNPKFTFETYIVGNSNRLAHAACVAVGERPAEAYNPLFLYGGTGLGKTHLLHALGWLTHTRGKQVVYISSETFTNEMINSIRNNTAEQFRRAYREVDALLIDDIQFIAGKDSTQEEFFHTFNSLHSANKQIVISSDRHPRAIPTLEERLRSRFEGGLIADIQPPDFETRAAILRFKAESQPLRVPLEVIDFLARKIQSNIRELSGALTRVVAYAQLMQAGLTVDLANTVLQDMFQHQPLSVEEVLGTVADYYRINIDDLKGRGRNKEVVLPRQMAMYFLREETSASLPQIGELLGGRDHTTVMYSVEKITQEIEQDDQRRREMLTIKERLYRGQRD